MIRIAKVESEEELHKAAEELFNTLVNLRFHTSKWYSEGGYTNRVNRLYWEAKCDTIIEKLIKKEK